MCARRRRPDGDFAVLIANVLLFNGATGRQVNVVGPRRLADLPRRDELPVLRALPTIHMALQTLDLSWGPVGSVGFELATAFPAANCSSDLDLIIRLSDALVPRVAEKVVEAIEDAGTRVDVLLETAAGAIALAEYVRSGPNLLLRTGLIALRICKISSSFRKNLGAGARRFCKSFSPLNAKSIDEARSWCGISLNG